MESEKIPNRIYKYANAEKQSLSNIKNQIIYMAPPLIFNDPYDCSLNIKAASLSKENVNRIREYYITIESTPESIRRELLEKKDDSLIELMQKSIESAISQNRDEFLNKNGVCCFSETNNNLLMWAHYSDSFKGYCLEFSTDREPFNKIKKVTYSNKIPKFDIPSFIFEDKGDQILDLFLTKAVDWNYEHEWRIMHSEAKTKYSYESESLKAIYFGPKMDFTIKEIICLILQNQNENVEFWDSKLSIDKFAIEFNKVTYVPYLKKNKDKK